jgi:YggT family protein
LSRASPQESATKVNSIASAVQLIVYGLTLVVFLDVLLAFVLNPFHPLRRALDSVVEPMLAPIRRIVPSAGGLDFSPAILIILLQILGSVVVKLLASLG